MSFHGKSITAVGGSVLLILVVFGSILAFTKNPLSLDDGLRHFVLAERYRAEGIEDPSWSDFFFQGYFTRHRVDPWFLADLSYVPFTNFENRVTGIKAATFFFLCTLLFSVLLFLRRVKIRPVLGCIVLLLFFFGSSIFSFRLMLGRPFVLVTSLLLLVLYAVIERRWILLGFLLLLSVLFSHLFVFPLGAASLGALWWLWRRDVRAACFAFAAVATGVIFGVILHPQSIEYLTWMKDIFFLIPLSKNRDLGGEVYSGLGFGDISVFLVLALAALLIVLLALRGELKEATTKHPEIYLFGLLATLFFFAFLFWARAIDLFWPMGILFLLSLLTATEGVQKDAEEKLRTPYFPFRLTALHLIFVLLLTTGIGETSRFIGKDESRSPEAFAAIRMVPAGARVFDIDWDYFPVLLFLRSDLLYARGVDPTLDNPEMFSLIERLTDVGIFPDSPLFSREWMRELIARIDIRQLGIQHIREADVDAGAWLNDSRALMNPEYIVLYRARHLKLIQQLKERKDVSLLAEQGAIAVFAVHPE